MSKIVGLNIGALSPIDRGRQTADLVPASTGFLDANFQNYVPVDANGWPTVANFALHALDGLNNAADLAAGYPMILGGYADFDDSAHGRQIVNHSYNAATNITTATYVLPPDNGGQFTVRALNAVRTGGPGGGGPSGCTFWKILRPIAPGGPAHGPDEFWSRELIAYLKALLNPNNLPPAQLDTYVRDLNTSGADGAPDSMIFSKATRKRPSYAIQSDYAAGAGGMYGIAFEHMVDLANQIGVGVSTCIPDEATDDFATEIFRIAAFGSDGTNAYTAPVANPIWAPLGRPLRFTASNETWNTAAPYSAQNARVGVAAESAALRPVLMQPDGNTDHGVLTWRWPAWFLDHLSGLAAAVYGPNMLGPGYRPILNGQREAPVVLQQALLWLGGKYATGPGTISKVIWGAGDGTYSHLALMPADDPPAGATTAQMIAGGLQRFAAFNQSCAFVRAADPGLKLCSYEGGPCQGDSALGPFTMAVQADPAYAAIEPAAMALIHETYDEYGQYDTSEVSFGLFDNPADVMASPKARGFAAGVAALGLNGGTPPAPTSILADPGFESYNASTPTASNGIAAHGFLQAPPPAAWTFTGAAGVADANSPYVGGGEVRGFNVAHLPGTGTIGQTATVAAGTYTLGALVRQQVGASNDFGVWINGTQVDGAPIATQHPVAGIKLLPYTSPPFVHPGGALAVEIRGLQTAGGGSMFLDNIDIALVGGAVPTTPPADEPFTAFTLLLLYSHA